MGHVADTLRERGEYVDGQALSPTRQTAEAYLVPQPRPPRRPSGTTSRGRRPGSATPDDGHAPCQANALGNASRQQRIPPADSAATTARAIARVTQSAAWVSSA